MSQLESFLQNRIPMGDAAAFLIKLKGGEKTASTKEVLAAIETLPKEDREEAIKAGGVIPLLLSVGYVKSANAAMGGAATVGGAASLPPSATGKAMPPVTPTNLPNTAMGMNNAPAKVASKSTAEIGKERGETATAAHFERESHRHGERSGATLGKLVGLAGGAAAAHHIGKGNPLASIAGAALGQHVGSSVGRQAGRVSDEHKFKHAAAVELFLPDTLHYHGDAVRHALLHGNNRGTVIVPDLSKYASAFKLALEEAGVEQPQPGQPQQQQARPQPPPPQQQGIVPEVPPEVQAMLAMEQEGDNAAAQQQLEFVRAKLQEAVAENQAATQKAEELEGKQQLTDQQLAQYQSQVADATQKAMTSQDEVLQQQQAAAAMRMAYQQLRGTLLQAASTDPPSLSGNDAAMAAASTAAGPQSGPGPQTGPAGNAPNPGTPGTVAPEGDDQVSQQIQPNEPMFGNASPTTQVGQKEPQGDAKIPGKEVLSSARPLVRQR